MTDTMQLKRLSDDAMSDGFEDYGIALSEAATALEQSTLEIKEYREALRKLEVELTCRDDDDTHYCPNCDSSLYDALAIVRAALNHHEGSEG